HPGRLIGGCVIATVDGVVEADVVVVVVRDPVVLELFVFGLRPTVVGVGVHGNNAREATEGLGVGRAPFVVPVGVKPVALELGVAVSGEKHDLYVAVGGVVVGVVGNGVVDLDAFDGVPAGRVPAATDALEYAGVAWVLALGAHHARVILLRAEEVRVLHGGGVVGADDLAFDERVLDEDRGPWGDRDIAGEVAVVV